MQLVSLEEAADRAGYSKGHAYKLIQPDGPWIAFRLPRLVVLADDYGLPLPRSHPQTGRHIWPHPSPSAFQIQMGELREAYEQEVTRETYRLLYGPDWAPPDWMPTNRHEELARAEAERCICHRATEKALRGVLMALDLPRCE